MASFERTTGRKIHSKAALQVTQSDKVGLLFVLVKEPRSEQLPFARVTAFSRTSLCLERFWREF